jgi:dolichol kinase
MAPSSGGILVVLRCRENEPCAWATRSVPWVAPGGLPRGRFAAGEFPNFIARIRLLLYDQPFSLSVARGASPMTAITSNAEIEALRVLEARAQELRDFLESLPTHLKWERFDELRDRCARLKDNFPRPPSDERMRAAWVRTQERLSELHLALSSRSPRAGVIACYDDLSRAYELWLAAFRARAHAVGLATAVNASSVKPLIRARTLFHIAMGMTAVSLYQFFITRSQAMVVLLSLFAVAASLEITRRFSSRWNHILLTSPVFHPIARPREYHAVNSSTWYLMALCLITPLFSQPAVCAGVLILGLADPAAAWFGKKYGKTKLYRQKSVVGTLAFFAVAFAAASAYFVGLHAELSLGRCLAGAALAGAAGAVAELFSERIDDNFTVPIAAVLAASILI